MSATLQIIAVVVLLAVWWFMRKKPKPSTKKKKLAPAQVVRASEKSSEFHAVSIKFSNRVCAAAKALDGQRILSEEAPLLPLAECDLAECNCHFVHYKDRRARVDRRSPFASSISIDATGRFERDRREKDDRRDEDEIEF